MSENIEVFLSRLGLAEYAANFAAQGFDNMDRLKRMQSADMVELGMKLGHRRQLQDVLDQVKIQEGMQVACTPQLEIDFNNPFPLPAQPDLGFISHPLLACPGIGMPMYLPYGPSWGFSSPCGWLPLQYPSFGGVGAAWASSDSTNIPDKHVVLTVGLVRLLLLEEGVAGAPPELLPFTRNGEIGLLCVEALEAASKHMRNKNPSAARSCASAAVLHLTLASSQGRVKFPSHSEFIRAGWNIAKYRYEDAKRVVDDQTIASALKASHNEFERCEHSLRYHLFSALVELKKTPKNCLQTLKHTLNTLVLLTCVDDAGGHFSRDVVYSVITQDFPRDREISHQQEMDFCSGVWHCFHKVFADLAGAPKFKFKAARPARQQDRQPETDEEQRDVVFHSAEEQPEVVFHSAEESADDPKSGQEPRQQEDGADAKGADEMPQKGFGVEELMYKTQRSTADPLPIQHDDGTLHWQDQDTARVEEAEVISKPCRIRSAEDFDNTVTQQYVVKKTFIELVDASDASHAPVCPPGKARSEPPPCQLGASSAGDPVCMEPLLEGQEDTPEDRILVISELNFALVWRDYSGNYHNRYPCGGGLELESGHRLHIRPGAKEFVAEVLQHDRCQLTFHSCGSFGNVQAMAKLLLQEAVPGDWVANAESELPFLKGPDGQRVYLAYGKRFSGMPRDFQEQGKHALVKDMDRVCDALCKVGCFFNPSNTIMIDSTMGINSSTENLMQIDSWRLDKGQKVNEDGTIFKELQEYLWKFLQSTPLPKVQAYLKEHPSKFHPSAGASSSEVTELNAAASNSIQAWKMHVESHSNPEDSVEDANSDSEVLMPDRLHDGM